MIGVIYVWFDRWDRIEIKDDMNSVIGDKDMTKCIGFIRQQSHQIYPYISSSLQAILVSHYLLITSQTCNANITIKYPYNPLI